jgi:SAM-dependent methyltransferase
LLSSWLETPAGKALLEQERKVTGRVLERVFGDQILQIGSWGPVGELLESARTQYSAVLGSPDDTDAHVAIEPTRLAVLTDSVDAVLLPHTLDLSKDPHGVLREVHRILRPDGKLIVLGINPHSWWGMRNRFTPGGFPPAIRRHISRRRLADWLRLLNLSIDKIYPCFASSAGSPFVRRHFGWFASTYMLVATKETIPMTIIRPRLQRRQRLVGSFANPTTRNVG